jgi:hypothetical protein
MSGVGKHGKVRVRLEFVLRRWTDPLTCLIEVHGSDFKFVSMICYRQYNGGVAEEEDRGCQGQDQDQGLER